MGVNSLFLQLNPVTVNNAEGAILLQLLLQVSYKFNFQTFGDGLMDEFITPILSQAIARINKEPNADFLTRE